ncbi:hypothetical protein JLK41_15085 [Ectopseudomonas khazarica]|uniref:hypothetical protein n=1 Tax=Ectopseudomonas khazarica TaxID=2502979 RepID=UPI001AEFDD61|nr:hypothetical protein [Pseudomonas khazarica]QTS84658.1 hypothetical protein JLK41_15085 [Pseudomonas khazarica]
MAVVLCWIGAGLLALACVIGIIIKYYHRNRMLSVCTLVAGILFIGGIAKFNTGLISWIGWFYFGLLFCFWWWIDSQDEKRR